MQSQTGSCGSNITMSSNGYDIQASSVTNLAFYGFTFNALAYSEIDGYAPSGGIIINGGSGYTIRWNTFTNCVMGCIGAVGATNMLIDSNTMSGITDGYPSGFDIDSTSGDDGLCFPPSAITLINNSESNVNNTISYNSVSNAQGGAVTITEGGNNIVTGNIVSNVGTELYDGGALYYWDNGTSTAGNQFTNNTISNVGGTEATGDQVKSLYLDNASSHVLLSGNISGACGTYAVQIHGGEDNTLQNNIFDVSSGAPAVMSQPNSSPSTSMSGNTFEHNIVYSSGSFPSTVFDQHRLFRHRRHSAECDRQISSMRCPGGSVPTNSSATISDPVDANPEFTAASSGNYSMPSTSPAYTEAGFVALATNRGPSANTVCPSGY